MNLNSMKKLAPLLFLSLAACGAQPPPPQPPPPSQNAKPSLLTYDNYRQIQNGMTEDAVRAFLGDPAQIVASDSATDSSLILRWKSDDRTAAGTEPRTGGTVAVYFKKGKVVSKEATLFK